MADIMTRAERSQRMALIRSKDTKPELALRRTLHAQGLRYRVNDSRLPGKPDLVFGPAKTVVFVNGCFWHGHKCSIGHIPKTNSPFWTNKILVNRKRDARNIRTLRAQDWKVIVVWECKLKNVAKLTEAASHITVRLAKLRMRHTTMKSNNS